MGICGPATSQTGQMKMLATAALLCVLRCSASALHPLPGIHPLADAGAAHLRGGGLFDRLKHRKDLALSTSNAVAKAPGNKDTADSAAEVVEDAAESAKSVVDTAPIAADSGEASAAVTPAADAASVVVPALVNTDADGFPSLPEVTTIADSSVDTLKKLNSQASILEARIAQTQMENEAKLTREKMAFDARLKQQEQVNRAVITENEQIEAKTASVKSASANVTNQARQLEKDNKIKRAELKSIQGKITRAKEFIAASIKVASDQSAHELTLLQGLQGAAVVTDFRHQIALVTEGSETRRETSEDRHPDDEEYGLSFLQEVSDTGHVTVEVGTSGLKKTTQSSKVRNDQISNIETRLKRAELKMLGAKLKIAGDFVSDSLKATADSGAHELAVLQTKPAAGKEPKLKRKHQHVALVSTESRRKRDYGDASAGEEQDVERSIEEEKGNEDTYEDRPDEEFGGGEVRDAEEARDVDRDVDTAAGFSFLAVSAKAKRASTEETAEMQLGQMSDVERSLLGAGVSPGDGSQSDPATNPEDLLKVLQSGITTLATQKKTNGEKLKAMFVKAYKGGNQRHAALLAQQKSLNSTYAAAMALQSKLVAAKQHLEGTRDDVHERLRSITSFLDSIGNLGVAQVDQIQAILKANPEGTAPLAASGAKIAFIGRKQGAKTVKKATRRSKPFTKRKKQ